MKKILTISLLLLYLSSGTELYQIFKLPFLIEHFLQHKKEESSISFLGFLAIHYADGIKYDEDSESDKKLPFKSCCHGEILMVNAVVPPTKIALHIKESFLLQNEFYLSDATYTPSSFFVSIWQPPKSC